MPIYEDHLKHWGFKKGEESKDHKYYAREETSGNKNKYRYFYTKAAYDAFKNAWKSGAKTISNTAKKVTSSYTSSYKSGLKQLGTTGKSFIDNYRVGLGIKKKSNIHYDKPIGPGLQVKASGPVIDYAAKNVPDSAKSGPERKHKYIAKVKLSNGKTRYFYNQSQYQRYLQIHKYQEKEPEFMKKVPEIEITEDSVLPSRNDDSAIVNTTAKIFNDVNCIYCTLTYEMRRRGYDVTAADKESNHTSLVVHNEWYENANVIEDPTPVTVDYKGTFGLDKVNIIDEKRLVDNENAKSVCAADYFMPTTDEVTTEQAQTVYKAMQDKLSDFPKGSRGDMAIFWRNGGGHSIVWEKDEFNKVIFRDTQDNTVWSDSKMVEMIRDYGSCTNSYQFVRTDNLQFKEEVLDYVKSNR